MQFVKIYKLENNGDQKVIAFCKQIDHGIACEGDKILIKNLRRDGIRDYSQSSPDARLFPHDGIKFLENLQHAFRSGYIQATGIQNA